jgi:hypothetical protein
LEKSCLFTFFFFVVLSLKKDIVPSLLTKLILVRMENKRNEPHSLSYYCLSVSFFHRLIRNEYGIFFQGMGHIPDLLGTERTTGTQETVFCVLIGKSAAQFSADEGILPYASHPTDDVGNE